jgi:hypothetical protein
LFVLGLGLDCRADPVNDKNKIDLFLGLGLDNFKIVAFTLPLNYLVGLSESGLLK